MCVTALNPYISANIFHSNREKRILVKKHIPVFLVLTLERRIPELK